MKTLTITVLTEAKSDKGNNQEEQLPIHAKLVKILQLCLQ